MERKMVPLDLVLGILKDKSDSGYDLIDAAFPLDPPPPSQMLAWRGEGDPRPDKSDVMLSMPPGVAHRLHDALCRVLRSDCFMDNPDSRSARRSRDEEHEVLQTLQSHLHSTLRLLGKD